MARASRKRMNASSRAGRMALEFGMEHLVGWTIQRLRLVEGVRLAAKAALFSVPAALLLFAALRLWPIVDTGWIVPAVGAAAPMLAFVFGYAAKPSRLAAAVRVDRAMQLKEALSTAVAFSANADSELIAALNQQARLSADAVQRSELRRRLPLQGAATLALAALVLACGSLGLLQLPHLVPPAAAQAGQTPEEKSK